MQRLLSAAAFWALWWVVLFAIWETQQATGEATEVVAGAVAAALGATLAEAIRRRGLSRIRLRSSWLLPVSALPWKIVRGLVVLAEALLLRTLGRPVRAAYRAVPFPAGRADPDSRGRRALATLVGSVSPNTIVLDIDEERKIALKHDLVPDRASDRVP